MALMSTAILQKLIPGIHHSSLHDEVVFGMNETSPFEPHLTFRAVDVIGIRRSRIATRSSLPRSMEEDLQGVTASSRFHSGRTSPMGQEVILPSVGVMRCGDRTHRRITRDASRVRAYGLDG